MIILPGKLSPWRHMVEPQSPLYNIRSCIHAFQCYEPEVGNNLISTVCLRFVLLWSSLDHLESIRGVHAVTGIR